MDSISKSVDAISDSDEVCIAYQSNYFPVVSDKHGSTVPQIVSFLKNMNNLDTDTLKRLSEQGKIYNCLT